MDDRDGNFIGWQMKETQVNKINGARINGKMFKNQ